MIKKRKINFLLYGEGSFLNKGCEAIVNTTTKKIKNSCDGKIILATNDINYDKQYYNEFIDKYVKGYYKQEELSEEEKEKIEYYNTIPFDYTNFETIYEKDSLKEIENVDICLSVGGDNYCYGEPNWIYTINKKIKENTKKNVLWSTSLFDKIESDEMIRDLKSYDIILTRESLTYKALEMYIEKDRLMLEPDTAFSLGKKEIDLPRIFDNNKVVGINISPLISNYTNKNDNTIESIKKLIDYILAKTDNNICLIPHVYIEGNNDLELLETIKELYKNEERIALLNDRIYDCEELKYVISKCDMLIAARTHASIAGYSSIIPTLVLGYSIKSKGIALDLFGEYDNYVISVNEITPEILIEKYNYINNNKEKIKEVLTAKMQDYKMRADNQLEKVLDRLDELDKKYVTPKNLCTGCMACFNVCQYDAIEYIEDKKGFIYPIIDKKKCTKCGLCKKVCPSNKIYNNSYESPKFYAAINKNEEDRENSSSGGIVGIFAKEILKNNGVIYGATLDEGKEVKHIRVDDLKDLYKIMGSKYAQSKINKIYRQVKKDLEENKKVLFTGTPCQIEGVKNFLGKKYDNIMYLSIICHGVPSPKVFKKYVEEKEIKTKNIVKNIEFRNKKFGWHKFSMKYQYKNEKENETIPFTEDYFMQGFLKNYYLREACYNCYIKFDKKNTSDLIVGDFWGIENVFPEMDDDKGVSALIINSEKGQRIFEEIKEKIEYKETTLHDVLRGNPVLLTPVKYTKQEEKFFELFEKYDIEMIINSLKGIEMSNDEKQPQEIEQMKKEINVLNNQIKDLLEAKKYFLGQIELRDIQLKQKDEEIQKIYSSKKWKLANKISIVMNKLKRKKD